MEQNVIATPEARAGKRRAEFIYEEGKKMCNAATRRGYFDRRRRIVVLNIGEGEAVVRGSVPRLKRDGLTVLGNGFRP